MNLTRRELGKLVLTSVPAVAVLSRGAAAGQTRPKPDSRWAGVQVGMNVPYNFGVRTMTLEETLDRTLQLGVSAVELRSQPVELFMGVPKTVLEPGREKPAQ